MGPFKKWMLTSLQGATVSEYITDLSIFVIISVEQKKNTKRGLLQSLKYESIWQMEHLKLKMPVGKEYLYVTLNHKTSHK